MSNKAKKSILLVEDNPGHAELVIRAIEGNEACSQIYHVLDGSSALNFLEHKGNFNDGNKYPRPDMVLLDLRLPKINGLDVLKYIKSTEAYHYIPVIVLTTSDAEKDIAQAYDYHANSYLVKPMDFEKFKFMMDQICNYWLCMNQIPSYE